MRIVLVISALDCGGAERVMSIMANYWASRGEKVTLITLEHADRDFYPLDRRVRRVGLGLLAPSSNIYVAIKSNVSRVRRLRAAMRECQPDVIISFVHKVNLVTLFAAQGLRVPVVVSERTDPQCHAIEPIWSRLRRWLYPRAHAVVVQTTAVRDWAALFLPSEKIHVIPNPIEIRTEDTADIATNLNFRSPFAVAVGRLQPVKGFDLLVQAFARCEHRDWSLAILGEGPDRGRLESMIRHYGLETKVHMPGKLSSVDNILRRASMFILSSRYEGFPNVLLEAMSYGLPVLSFDCPSGPRFIIEDGVNGMLVPAEDVNALASAMDRLMADRDERGRLGRQARDIVGTFSLDKIMNSWYQILIAVSPTKPCEQPRL